MFYKKIVATKLWGSVMPLSFFPAYCGVVLLSAAVIQKLFVVSVQQLLACQGGTAVSELRRNRCDVG